VYATRAGFKVPNIENLPVQEASVVLIDPAPHAIIRQNSSESDCPRNRIGGHVINFQWEAFAGASSYRVYVKHRGALKPIVDRRINATRYNAVRCGGYVIDSNLTGWEWRVEAFNADGRQLAFSETRPFQFEACRRPDGRDCALRP
jgi:hypothetical protein